MKRMLISTLLLLISIESYSFETTIKDLYKHIENKMNSSSTISVDDIKGEWLSTYHQQQIFPGSCNPDGKEKITLELYDAWNKIVITAARGHKLEPVILFQTLNFPYPDNGDIAIKGEAFILNDPSSPNYIYCASLDEMTKEAKAIVCYQNFYNHDPCGWYAFFIRE